MNPFVFMGVLTLAVRTSMLVPRDLVVYMADGVMTAEDPADDYFAYVVDFNTGEFGLNRTVFGSEEQESGVVDLGFFHIDTTHFGTVVVRSSMSSNIFYDEYTVALDGDVVRFEPLGCRYGCSAVNITVHDQTIPV